MDRQLILQIKQFLENEARSGSMDFGCVTLLYIYRMFGGTVALDEIEAALPYCKKELGL